MLSVGIWDLSAPRGGVSAILWEINGEITTFPANKTVEGVDCPSDK